MGLFSRLAGAPGNRRHFWLVAALVTAIVLIFLFAGNGIYGTLALKRRLMQIETRIDSLQQMNNLMKKKLDGFKKGDPLILEEEARSHGLVKPGEKVYLLKPESERKGK